MWVAKIKLLHMDCVSSQLAKKYGITNFVYCLNYYEEEGYNYFSTIHIPVGEDKKVTAFIAEMKKDKRIYKFEQSDNIIFMLIREPVAKGHLVDFFDPRLFYVRPDINAPDGFEYFEVGSWSKEPLEKLIMMAKKHMQGELLYIKQKKLSDIYIPHIMPSS